MVDIYHQRLYASTGATRNNDGDDDDDKLSLIIRAFQAFFRSFLTNQCKKDFLVWSLIFCRCFSIFNSTVSILGFQSLSVELGFWIAIFSGIQDSSGKIFPDP